MKLERHPISIKNWHQLVSSAALEEHRFGLVHASLLSQTGRGGFSIVSCRMPCLFHQFLQYPSRSSGPSGNLYAPALRGHRGVSWDGPARKLLPPAQPCRKYDSRTTQLKNWEVHDQQKRHRVPVKVTSCLAHAAMCKDRNGKYKPSISFTWTPALLPLLLPYLRDLLCCTPLRGSPAADTNMGEEDYGKTNPWSRRTMIH